jgi:hypothetical protein
MMEQFKKEVRKYETRRWLYRMMKLIYRSIWYLLVFVLLAFPLLVLYSIFTAGFNSSDLQRILGKPSDTSVTLLRIAVVLLLFSVGWLTGWIIRRAIREARRTGQGHDRKTPMFDRLYVVIAFTPALLTIFVYCAFFMLMIYPSIPEQFGGGRPQKVSILFTDDVTSELGEAHIPLEGKKRRLSVPLELVHEADTVYVIRLPDQRIMRINKDLVSIVVSTDTSRKSDARSDRPG